MARVVRQQVVTPDPGGATVVSRRRVETAPVPDEHPQVAYRQKRTIFRTYQVVWYILGIIEFLLLTRFLLRFLGANPASGFANFIYTFSYPFAAPFMNLFRPLAMGGSVLEWGTLIGAILYPIFAQAIIHLFQLIKPTTPEEVEENVDNQ